MWGIYKNRPPRTCAEDDFSKLNSIHFFVLVNWVYFICDLTHSDLVFPTYSLQIHCFGLFESQSIYLGLGHKSWPTMKGDWKKEERNTVAIKNQTCNRTCKEYIRIDLLGPVPMMIFINLIQFVSLSLWIESTLFVIQLILTQFFQPIFYKFIVLVFLGLSPSILGQVTNLVLTKSILLQNLSSKQIRIHLKNFLLDLRLWENVSSFHPNDQEKIKRAYLQRCSCQCLSHDFPKKEINGVLHWFNLDYFKEYKILVGTYHKKGWCTFFILLLI